MVLHTYSAGCSFTPPMVDPKGIEPSNLTDANRALSQLSYEPIAEFILTQIPSVVKGLLKKFNIHEGSLRNVYGHGLLHLSKKDTTCLLLVRRTRAVPRGRRNYP